MPMPDSEKRDSETKDRPGDRDYTYIKVIAVVAAVGEVFVILFAGDFSSFVGKVTAAALVTAVALASLVTGGFGGFLFGVPRRLQEPVVPQQQQPAGSAAKARTSQHRLYAGNTNLEQISDWLTKIIVGVGLVEVRQISDFITAIGTGVAASLGRGPDQIAFPIAIVIFYFICGFMIGYLWARLYLGRDLDEAERADQLEEKLDKLTQQYQMDASAISLARKQLGDEISDRPRQDALEEAVAAASSDTRGYIFYYAQNLRWQNWRNSPAVMERTIPVFRALIASDRDEQFFKNHGQLAYALKDRRKPAWDEAERNFTIAIARRGDAEERGWHAYEANRALCRIHLDQNFKPKKPAEKAVRDKILADLRVASLDYWTSDWIEKDKTVKAWLDLNDLTWKTVTSMTDEPG
jgi:hypothetical protein